MSSKPRRGNHVSRRTVHKVVVRRIPPTLDEAIFRKTVAATLPSTDYFCWHQGKVSYGPPFAQPCGCAADRLYGPAPRLTWQYDRCVQLGIEKREMVCSVPQFYFGPVGAGCVHGALHVVPRNHFSPRCPAQEFIQGFHGFVFIDPEGRQCMPVHVHMAPDQRAARIRHALILRRDRRL